MFYVEKSVPNYFLPALINGDFTGLNESDRFSLDNFIEENLNEHENFQPMADIQEIGFTQWHDLKAYGVLACDCSNVAFAI